MQQKDPQEPGVSRREFVTTAAATAAGFMIVPRHVLGRGFQAPSDLVNVAAVGINGQGGINTRAVMSQNIVAICDCDTTLLDGRLQAWKTAGRSDGGAGRAGSERRHGRPRAGRGRAGGPGGAGRAGGPPPSPWREFETSKAQARCRRAVARRGPERDAAALCQRATAAPEEVSGLPRDVREAEGHRRGDHRHARSHARADRVGGDGARQARLRAEADVLVGGRGASSRQAGGREESRRADGQSESLARQRPAVRSSSCSQARSATSAKCTSGPTARGRTGRRASRVRRR